MGRNKHRRRGREEPRESRAAEVATVAWMMSVMTTLVCGGVAAVVLLTAGDRDGGERAQLLGRLLHFGAFVTAIVSLVLLGVVLKIRNEPPPLAVTWCSLAFALLAIGAAFLY